MRVAYCISGVILRQFFTRYRKIRNHFAKRGKVTAIKLSKQTKTPENLRKVQNTFRMHFCITDELLYFCGRKFTNRLRYTEDAKPLPH